MVKEAALSSSEQAASWSSWENLVEENPRRKLTQGQISFHSLDHDTLGKRGIKNVSFLVSPYHLSLPILPSRLAPQLSFPDSCPLKGRKAHFSLLLFFLILKKSSDAQNRGENGVLLCLVLRAPDLTRLAGCKKCQGPLCQL